MARKHKSPLFAESIDNNLYRLFFKIWQVDDEGRFHSPQEEELGAFVKAKPGESYEQTITTYDPAKGPKTMKFKKAAPQNPA